MNQRAKYITLLLCSVKAFVWDRYLDALLRLRVARSQRSRALQLSSMEGAVAPGSARVVSASAAPGLGACVVKRIATAQAALKALVNGRLASSGYVVK